ncbi:unnamed protein product [Lepeophtheirus salmonis]|uniref:(salmon louse) hypothetical protein n=1 Tax=Lepeophtheirus salmonis TaxID=72036 RepID=A0A817FCI8_LEPSM|nr:unnamed protein product [Lepeophtheirus salmonis]CAG9477687.1 unnamed protein product [Lepeophtheirus salmonis]
MIPIIRLVWIFGVIILIAESKDIKDFNSIISNRGSQLENLQSRLFGPKRIMVVHGWGGDCNLAWIVQMRRDLLNESDVNLFCADWRNGTIYPQYGQGAANTQLHLIGFSFGAQVCSFAGSNIPNCNRITGLDPTGPAFREHNTSFRLDKSDADFVDVIHTNGRNFIKGAIGLLEVSVGKESGCSLYRAVYLYLESIKNDKCKMVGFPCSGGWNGFHSGEQGCFNESIAFPLGLNTPRNATGELYLTTRIKEPFCGNQVKVEISLEFSPSWSSKLYTRILEIIFQTTGGEKRESFSVAR